MTNTLSGYNTTYSKVPFTAYRYGMRLQTFPQQNKQISNDKASASSVGQKNKKFVVKAIIAVAAAIGVIVLAIKLRKKIKSSDGPQAPSNFMSKGKATFYDEEHQNVNPSMYYEDYDLFKPESTILDDRNDINLNNPFGGDSSNNISYYQQ